jgi:hypothetical protein
MGTVTQIPRSVAGHVVICDLMDSLDDCEQLCEDYNASPGLRAAVSALFSIMDSMRIAGSDEQEIESMMTAMAQAALTEATMREDEAVAIATRYGLRW